jgi:hypothetical protein
MNYIPVSPDNVWEALGDGHTVIACVLCDTGGFHQGTHTLNSLSVRLVIDLINLDNTVFYRKYKED